LFLILRNGIKAGIKKIIDLLDLDLADFSSLAALIPQVARTTAQTLQCRQHYEAALLRFSTDWQTFGLENRRKSSQIIKYTNCLLFYIINFMAPLMPPNPGSRERLLHSIRKEDILSGFLSTLLWKLILPFHKFANLLFLCSASFSICLLMMCPRTLFLVRGVLGQYVPGSKCPSSLAATQRLLEKLRIF
jgi:hypothetical protein